MNNFKVEETFIKNSKIFEDGRGFFKELRIKEEKIMVSEKN